MEMAQHTTVRLVDDIDGTDAAGTISFGIDGKTYEIDLSEANTERFREAMAAYIKAARVVKRRPGRKLAVVESAQQAPSRAQRGPRTEAQEKRAWLAENGWPELAGKRGRFTAEQDIAWETRTPRGGAAQKAATVAEPSPAVAEVVETTEAPRKRGRKGKQDAGEASQGAALVAGIKASIDAAAPVEDGATRTRVTGMTGAQTAVLGELLPELVVESGTSWALLAGVPTDLIETINEKREAGVTRGQNNCLASVVRKLTEADPKYVKVA